MLYDIFTLYRNGEIIPYIILAFLCVGYVIIFEKFFLFQFVYKIPFEKFDQQMKKMLLANDMDRARSFSRSVAKTGLPLLVVKAIDAYEHDPMQVRATLSEEGLRFFPRVRRRMAQLPHFAAVCVILGALAAVAGIWNSFQMVDGLELGVKSFAFSKGLTLALLPLAISLAAAVLLMFPFGILDAMAWRLESEIEHSLCVVLNILAPDIQPVIASSAPRNEGPSGALAAVAVSAPAESPVLTSQQKVDNADPVADYAANIPDEEEII